LFSSQQTQALALTRPKTPKKEQSGSPLGGNNSRQQSESSLRSPISDIATGGARSITKTPNIHTNNDSGGDLSNAKIPQSPLPPSEKLNHHASDNSLNNNGVSQQQREQHQREQQFTSHGMGNGSEKILPSPSIDRKDFDFSKVNGE
jgi:hypothetical protein